MPRDELLTITLTDERRCSEITDPDHFLNHNLLTPPDSYSRF